MTHRPAQHKGAAHNIVHSYESATGLIGVVARVFGVVTIVTHDKQRTLGHGDVEVNGRSSSLPCRDGDVRLSDGNTIDHDLAVSRAALHSVSRQPNHALDEVIVAVWRSQSKEGQNPLGARLDSCDLHRRSGRKPATGIFEHHDVAVIHSNSFRYEFVDDDTVINHEGLFHRGRRDEEGTNQECLHQERDQNRDAENHQNVAKKQQHRTHRGTSCWWCICHESESFFYFSSLGCRFRQKPVWQI